MRHDLSFIDQPDWRRESTVSPTFLAAIIFCLFLAAGIGGVFYAYSEKLGRSYRLSAVRSSNDAIAERAGQIAQYNEQLAVWEQNLAAVQELRDQRLLWSRQLHSLWNMVPDDIILTQLSITAHAVRDAPAGAGRRGDAASQAPPRERLQYTMTITGVARGERAQEVITGFADRIPYDREIGRYLLSRELKNISGGADDEEKSFTIVCVYNLVG